MGKIDKYRAWFMGSMYYSDQETDEGYGIVCWRLDHRGMVLEIPCCDDIMHSNGVHEQKIIYHDFTIEDNVVFMPSIKVDNLYVGDVFTKAPSKNKRFLVLEGALFKDIITKRNYSFGEMCSWGWNPVLLGNQYQNPELLEYYPNGTFV